MKLRPLFNRVVIRPLKPEEKTKQGILLPGGVKEDDFLRGVIVDVGPGKTLECGKLIEPSVKAGDVVTFAERIRGGFVKIDGEEFLIMEEADILAVVEDGISRIALPDADITKLN